jgi:hypothetical protein
MNLTNRWTFNEMNFNEMKFQRDELTTRWTLLWTFNERTFNEMNFNELSTRWTFNEMNFQRDNFNEMTPTRWTFNESELSTRALTRCTVQRDEPTIQRDIQRHELQRWTSTRWTKEYLQRDEVSNEMNFTTRWTFNEMNFNERNFSTRWTFNEMKQRDELSTSWTNEMNFQRDVETSTR